MQDYLHRIVAIHLALQIPFDSGALRRLSPYLEASDLVPVEGNERQHHLAPQAARQWRAMKSAAAKDEIELLLISGFRSVERQRQIIEDKLRRGMDLGTILTVNAAPKFTYIRIFIPRDKKPPGRVLVSLCGKRSMETRYHLLMLYLEQE
jgi:zinc D-Ala-D-Ala carboxypeptidase